MDTQHITPEEVKNNYEFKVVRRILMDKYKWITDISVDEKDLNNYNLIFLQIHVDLDKFVKDTGAEPARWLRSFRGTDYTSSFISTPFQNLEYEEGRVIQDDMDDMMDKVRKTPAIPDELKLPRGRRFTPGQIIIPIPQDFDNIY
jgi:hypothetical protein